MTPIIALILSERRISYDSWWSIYHHLFHPLMSLDFGVIIIIVYYGTYASRYLVIYLNLVHLYPRSVGLLVN